MPPGSNGANYTGTLSTTISGRNCTTWAYSWEGVLNHNYCRNPDMSKTIWCYVKTDTGRGYEVEDCPRPACGKIIPVAIKEYIENVAKAFNIEYDTIDGMVDSKQLLENEKSSDMFRVGYNMFLVMTSLPNDVELFFENLVLHHPLDIILHVVFSLMQSQEKIYLKQDLTQEDTAKGCQPALKRLIAFFKYS